MRSLPHNPWSDPASDITDALGVTLESGLSDEAARSRLHEHGENVFEAKDERGALSIFLQQFANPLILLLCLAVVFTAALGEWLDTSIIAFAVIINAVLGFVQEYKAERAISDLRSYITHRTRVIRNGREIEIDPHLIVPGDLLHITGGSRITADARLLKEIDFTADEAILTGESLPVEKTTAPLPETTPLPERTNMIFAGTLGINGSAYAVVTATGDDTEVGKLARLVSATRSELTPLQQAMQKLTWVIIVVTTLLVGGIFVLGILQNQPLYEMLLLSIAVLVGSVPEALPIGLTAILAIGVERIAKRRGIMRSLTAAETLGSTTLIITDKTGTLTEATMRLQDIDTTAQLTAPDFTPADHHDQFNQEQRELLTLARCASDIVIENPEADAADWVLRGDDLERNIVRAAGRHGITQDQTDRADIQIRIPFSSKHKFSVTRIPSRFLPAHLSEFEDPHVVMGAPDILLDHAYLEHDEREELKAAVSAHSDYGRRVLGIGLLTPKTDDPSLTVEHARDLVFLGVLSFFDPVRAAVPAALTRINEYGARVIMATGDLPGTAMAVANELGWNVTRRNVLTGAELDAISDDDLIAILNRIHIFARVTPQDKLRITKLHQQQGAVVAMTGDGVNDAPSLKAANIGVAVGSGSDVAKSVADLILLDDNFATIVATIEEGKQILSNIKKVFVYLMSNALDELILVGGAIVLAVPFPLTAVQIIWVNLFAGSLPAIAFAFDGQRMRESETSSRQFFDPRTVFLTTSVGVAVSVFLLALYLFLLNAGVATEIARSVLFASFGAYALITAFSFLDLSRPLFTYPLFQNRVLLLGVIVGLSLMAASLYVPVLQEILNTTPLPLPWLGFVVVWLIGNLMFVEAMKWFANTFLVREPAR